MAALSGGRLAVVNLCRPQAVGRWPPPLLYINDNREPSSNSYLPNVNMIRKNHYTKFSINFNNHASASIVASKIK